MILTWVPLFYAVQLASTQGTIETNPYQGAAPGYPPINAQQQHVLNPQAMHYPLQASYMQPVYQNPQIQFQPYPALMTQQIPVTEEVDLTKLDTTSITQQVDSGELPSIPILSAILSAPEKFGKSLPPELAELKHHLLDRIINHNTMLMKALESKDDAIMKGIAKVIFKEKKKSSEIPLDHPSNPPPLPDMPPDLDRELEDPEDYNAEESQGPPLPAVVGFDPFLQKPKPGFFGRIRGWFRRGKPEPNLGNYMANEKNHQNSFETHKGAWGKSSVYHPPMQYASHLVPVSTGALDLKRLEFRPYRPGHPSITRRRILTRIIMKPRDSYAEENERYTEPPKKEIPIDIDEPNEISSLKMKISMKNLTKTSIRGTN